MAGLTPMNTTPQSYVLTSQYNEYDQYGSYFIAWFHRKPTAEEICKAIQADGALAEIFDYMSLAKRVLVEDARPCSDRVWYTLKQVQSSSAPAK